jgi:Uma2 family endonuclease
VPAGEPMSPARSITDEELLQLPEDGNKYEVVDGELVVSPGAGFRHEDIVAELVTRLRTFASERNLGRVLPSNLLFVLPSGNRRGPDVSFIAAERVAALPPDTVFPRLAPDLAVEVLSPSDSARRVQDKVGEYLEAGVRLVWVIDPENRRAVIYRALSSVEQITSDGTLEGEDVLPGFRCRLCDVLA